MITDNPNHSILHKSSKEGSPYDKATVAFYMVRGILGVAQAATESDYNTFEVYDGHVASAIEAARFLAEVAQEHVDAMHEQLLSINSEVPHE